MDLREKVSALLSKNRPSRYSMSDREWIEDAIRDIDTEDISLNVQDLVRERLLTMAYDIEGQATRAGNSIMREFHKAGALPIGWHHSISNPIAIEYSVLKKGKEVTVRERVRLAKATPKDFQLWAETEKRARERDYRARGEAIQGAIDIASSMIAGGFFYFEQWAPHHGSAERDVA